MGDGTNGKGDGMTDETEEHEPEICDSCHGTGEYRTEAGWRTCPACKGKGEFPPADKDWITEKYGQF